MCLTKGNMSKDAHTEARTDAKAHHTHRAVSHNPRIVGDKI